MNNGFIGEQFNSKSQLEKIVRGEKIFSIDPSNQLIPVLPLMSYISLQAASKNYREIVFGSFIRTPDASGKCTGHCAGKCIDINHRGGSFESNDSFAEAVKKNFGIAPAFITAVNNEIPANWTMPGRPDGTTRNSTSMGSLFGGASGGGTSQSSVKPVGRLG